MTVRARRWRLRKLVKPGLQLRVVLSFLLLAGVSALVQAIVLGRALGQLAARGGADEERMLSAARDLIGSHLALSLAVMAPLFVIVGVLVTFRIAGPIYRFERYFEDLAGGKTPGPCMLRRGDELQELCEWINRGVGRLRAGDAPPEAAADDARRIAA